MGDRLQIQGPDFESTSRMTGAINMNVTDSLMMLVIDLKKLTQKLSKVMDITIEITGNLLDSSCELRRRC